MLQKRIQKGVFTTILSCRFPASCVAGVNGKGEGSENAGEKWGTGARASFLAPLIPRLRLLRRLEKQIIFFVPLSGQTELSIFISFRA